MSSDHWEEAEAEGANQPHALRFPFGCGEVMYSTYHTTEYFERESGPSERNPAESMARRDEEACWLHVDDEQRSQWFRRTAGATGGLLVSSL